MRAANLIHNIITSSYHDIQDAATKIAWGKALNAGQSCVAPDYVLVPESQQTRFIELVKKSLADRYGSTDKMASNPDGLLSGRSIGNRSK